MNVAETVVAAVKAVVAWTKRNTVKIPAFVSSLLGLLASFDVIHLTAAQSNSVLVCVGAFLAFVTVGTVTANVRLGDGSAWGGLFGKSDPAPAPDPEPVVADVPVVPVAYEPPLVGVAGQPAAVLSDTNIVPGAVQ